MLVQFEHNVMKNSKESQNRSNVRINLKHLNSNLYVQNHMLGFLSGKFVSLNMESED